MDDPNNHPGSVAPVEVPPGEAFLLTGFPPLLRRCWYGLNQAFRRRLRPVGLTPIQYTVLRNLAEAGPDGLTQSELNERMASDPNTIAGLLARMEKNGWVKRHADPRDTRAKRVQLTSAGRQLQRAAKGVAQALLGEIEPALQRSQWPGFLEQLEAVAAACQEANRPDQARSSRRRSG